MIHYYIGVKHRKVINKLSKSSDPDDAIKHKKALEQVANSKSEGVTEINVTQMDSGSNTVESKGSFQTTTSTTSPQPLMKVDVSKTPGKSERNLPPGYVIVPSNVAGQPETFMCKICQHSSRDVFSVNAVRNVYIGLTTL